MRIHELISEDAETSWDWETSARVHKPLEYRGHRLMVDSLQIYLHLAWPTGILGVWFDVDDHGNSDEIYDQIDDIWDDPAAMKAIARMASHMVGVPLELEPTDNGEEPLDGSGVGVRYQLSDASMSRLLAKILRDSNDEQQKTEIIRSLLQMIKRHETTEAAAWTKNLMRAGLPWPELRAIDRSIGAVGSPRTDMIGETRQAAWQWLRNLLPAWPEYVLRDWLYQALKGVFGSGDSPREVIDNILHDEGMDAHTRWKLVPDFQFTLDRLNPWTVERIRKRWGGMPHPDIGATNDAARHATQAALAQQQGGVRREPVILKKVGNQYELIEGWHRTIQHFKQFPDGYVGPAWVAMDAKPVKEAEVDEARQRDESKPGSTMTVDANGNKEWHNANGQRHRLDGPAVEYRDGTKAWYVNGKMHRLDGPAYIGPDGSKEWYNANGQRHRLDGPAIEWQDGSKSWYVNGQLYTLAGWLLKTNHDLNTPENKRLIIVDLLNSMKLEQYDEVAQSLKDLRSRNITWPELDTIERSLRAEGLIDESQAMDKQLSLGEGSEQQYLWHGSRQKIPMLEPRQAVDTGGAAGSNQNAIYATSDPKVAIAMGLTTPGSDTAMFPNDPQMVLFKGKIRRGENVYLHKVPMNGPDGKPQFVQGDNSREFHSVPGVKGIKPVEIKAVPVDKYLNLIRQATPADLELQKKYMKQGDEAQDKQLSLPENFADGKGPGRPGDSQRHGIPKHATMAELQKAAKSKGRKGQLARWQINMRRGRKKSSR